MMSRRNLSSIPVILLFTLLAGVAAGPAADNTLQPLSPRDVARQLQQDPDNADLLALQGAMQRQAQDYAGAVATYERILALNPEDARSRNLLVMVLYKSARDLAPAEALPLLRRAVALAPEADFLRPDYLAALTGSGAATELIQAYEALPDDYALTAPALAAIADAYRGAGRPRDAARLYRGVLDAAPGDADAGLGLALALLEDDRIPDALAAIQQTLSLYPDRPTLLLALAAIQWKSGARVQALDTFERILAIDPRNTDAVNLKAQLLAEMGCLSLAAEVVAAYPDLVWPHVRHHIASRMAEARTGWNEDAAATNILPRTDADQLLALCYYDVSESGARHAAALDAARFLQQIEYLRTHDYRFVSAADIAAAQRGQRALPGNAVLLTFDHGYADIMTHVLPALELYGIPAIVSICPAWIENGPPVDLSGPLMNWEDVSRLAGHRLVTLGIEAEGLFELVRANPQGDTGCAAVTRIYDPVTGRYETEAEQRDRIHTTISNALRLMHQRVGSRPRVLVWSHGARNAPATAEAERLGFLLQLGLTAEPRATDSARLERIPVLDNPDIGAFIALARPVDRPVTPVRAVSVSLDAIDAPDGAALDLNIARLAGRLRAMGANTVILTACADVNADGNAEALYFPGTGMRVAHDVLDHVAARLQRDRLTVFLEMPVLSMDRPATPELESMRVMESRNGSAHPSLSMQKRYSPFHPAVTDWISQLYRDLAAHVRCDGIVFGEDAYLTDHEDYNPAALRVHATLPAPEERSAAAATNAPPDAWVRAKTETLTRLTLRLGHDVRRYRPDCRLARSLFAPALHYPESERWLAQNYNDALAAYDLVVLMAYVEMEDVRRPESWLADLVAAAENQPNGLERTVFKLQAVDWNRHKPVKPGALRDRLRHLARSGAIHLAYGPDDPGKDVPKLTALKGMLAEPTRPRK